MVTEDYYKAIFEAQSYLINFPCYDTPITANSVISEVSDLKDKIWKVDFDSFEREIVEAVDTRNEDKLRVVANFIVRIVAPLEIPTKLKGCASHLFDVSAVKTSIERRCADYLQPIRVVQSEETGFVKDLILRQLLILEEVILERMSLIFQLGLKYNLVVPEVNSEAVEAFRMCNCFVGDNIINIESFIEESQGQKGDGLRRLLLRYLQEKKLKKPSNNLQFANAIVKHCNSKVGLEMIRKIIRTI